MLSGSALTTYTFDANGSQTNVNAAGNLTTMVYDKERRMTSYADLSGTKLSSYNGDGMKASEGSTTIVWDGADYLGEVISGSFAKSIYTVEGQIIAENTPGLQRRDYWLSPLGTVSAAMDQTYKGHTTIQIYKPYGIRAFHSGDETTFRWVGAYGYRPTGYGFADWYIRFRHFSSKSANWTTLDPLWPDEWGFAYVNGMPTTAVDPSGTEVRVFPESGTCKANAAAACKKHKKLMSDKKLLDKLIACINEPKISPDGLIETILKAMLKACEGDELNCIYCPPNHSIVLKDESGKPVECGCNPKRNEDGKIEAGGTIAISGEPVSIPHGSYCGARSEPISGAVPPRRDDRCADLLRKSGLIDPKCKGIVILCPARNSKNDIDSIMHELAHVVGIGGRADHNKGNNDIVYRIGKCIAKIK